MSTIKMSDEEKQRILDKHKQSIKDQNDKKEELKKGLQRPENTKKTQS